MKQQKIRIASLFLACMLFLLAPVQAYAVQTDEKEMGNGQEGLQGAELPDQESPTGSGAPEVKGEEREETPEGTKGQDVLGQPGEVTEPITKEDKPYLALGANLAPAQQAVVLELLGINPEELEDYDVIYITNEEEHEYLGEYVAASKIGTRALSSVLIVKREQGNGINITTKNISYCTIGMYKNALITAGITDADIIVAGPFPISGTAALVGAMKAYSDMTGAEVSERSMDTALNELVLTGDIAETVGDSQKAEELVAYLKQEVIEKGLDSQQEIEEAIQEACGQFDITLAEQEIEELTGLLKKIGDLDLDIDSIRNQAEELYDKLTSLDTKSIFDRVADFFRSILEFFQGLFS
ncbi:DUF1002 domain-containing protein [Lachnospiraceae bacterium JLR.KK009]